MTTETTPTPAPTPVPRRSLWDVVLAATPVALTVLATILAGLSSGEMTRAQYHRSLAAQYQSKTSDQWAFFQAKRERATISTIAASQLRLQSSRQPFTVVAFKALMDREAEDFQRLDILAEGVLTLLKAREGRPDDVGKTLRVLALAFRKDLKKRVIAAEATRDNTSIFMGDADVEHALGAMDSGKLWIATDRMAKAADAETLKQDLQNINPDILIAFEAIDTHEAKDELDAICNRITEEQVRQALDVVEGHTERYGTAEKPIGDTHDHIGNLVDDCLQDYAWAREGASDLQRDAVFATHEEAKTPQSQVRTAVEALVREAEASEAAATRRGADFAAARLRYTARRYNHEAKYNQTSAWLNEIQVAKSGLTAERYRHRSSLFFYGMLAAQAGVTIATLALALRRKSPLWALATLTGLTAAAIGGYVYLFI